MQRVAAGDRQAQEALLRRLRHRVHVVSAAVLGHEQDAEDATQASLIQILRRAGTYRGESRLESWAIRISARQAIRLAQERRLRTARLVEGEQGEQVPIPDPSEDEVSGIPREVRDYLQALPEALRNALILRHMLGYTIPEIAEILETSPNTIKDRLQRGRHAIRRIIRRDQLATSRPKANHS